MRMPLSPQGKTGTESRHDSRASRVSEGGVADIEHEGEEVDALVDVTGVEVREALQESSPTVL